MGKKEDTLCGVGTMEHLWGPRGNWGVLETSAGSKLSEGELGAGRATDYN